MLAVTTFVGSTLVDIIKCSPWWWSFR